MGNKGSKLCNEDHKIVPMVTLWNTFSQPASVVAVTETLTQEVRDASCTAPPLQWNTFKCLTQWAELCEVDVKQKVENSEENANVVDTLLGRCLREAEWRCREDYERQRPTWANKFGGIVNTDVFPEVARPTAMPNVATTMVTRTWSPPPDLTASEAIAGVYFGTPTTDASAQASGSVSDSAEDHGDYLDGDDVLTLNEQNENDDSVEQ